MFPVQKKGTQILQFCFREKNLRTVSQCICLAVVYSVAVSISVSNSLSSVCHSEALYSFYLRGGVYKHL
jgi:hypothetical protein